MNRKQLEQLLCDEWMDMLDEFGCFIDDAVFIGRKPRERKSVDLQGCFNSGLLVTFNTPAVISDKPRFIQTNLSKTIHPTVQDNVTAHLHSVFLDIINRYDRGGFQVLWSKRIVGHPHFKTIHVPSNTLGIVVSVS